MRMVRVAALLFLGLAASSFAEIEKLEGLTWSTTLQEAREITKEDGAEYIRDYFGNGYASLVQRGEVFDNQVVIYWRFTDNVLTNYTMTFLDGRWAQAKTHYPSKEFFSGRFQKDCESAVAVIRGLDRLQGKAFRNLKETESSFFRNPFEPDYSECAGMSAKKFETISEALYWDTGESYVSLYFDVEESDSLPNTFLTTLHVTYHPEKPVKKSMETIVEEVIQKAAQNTDSKTKSPSWFTGR